MSYITPAQLAHQRRVTGGTFTDTCQRLVFDASDGSYGAGTGQPDYLAGASIPCSFQGVVAPDAQEDTEVPITKADLYVAHDATLDPSDRVTITHIYGELQSNPLTFDIAEGPLMEGNVLWARLVLATDGTDEE